MGMKTRLRGELCSALSVACFLGAVILSSAGVEIDTVKIEQLTGLKGVLNESEGVFKVSAPRSDLKVSVDKWVMQPFMGLTSWAAFMKGMKADAMVMGDLVLFEDEVNAVMSAALDNGLAVTALHNHFFFDDPKVYFMHIGGEGTVEQLAKGVKAAFDASKQVRSKSAQPAKTFAGAIPAQSSIGPEALQRTLSGKPD